MTFTTDFEAYEELSKINTTKDEIIAFVRQLSVDVGLSNDAETVLYTGKTGDANKNPSAQPSHILTKSN